MRSPWASRTCIESKPAARARAQLSVAHIIVGAARSLPSPSVYVPLRDLFLDGLGGERVHLFVYLDLAPELSAKGQWRAIDRAALGANVVLGGGVAVGDRLVPPAEPVVGAAALWRLLDAAIGIEPPR